MKVSKYIMVGVAVLLVVLFIAQVESKTAGFEKEGTAVLIFEEKDDPHFYPGLETSPTFAMDANSKKEILHRQKRFLFGGGRRGFGGYGGRGFGGYGGRGFGGYGGRGFGGYGGRGFRGGGYRGFRG